MGFESGLAARVARKQGQSWPWKRIGSVALIVFIVLTLTASTTASSQAVIQLSHNNSYAKYMGLFDGKANTVMVGTVSIDGWVVLKLPFKGYVSDLRSISFSEFISQTGGTDLCLEPYVVLKLPRGNSLVCYPGECYANGEWTLPYFNWQLRDTVAKGQWVDPSAEYKVSTMSLDSWADALGDPSVIQILIVIGGWDISKPYKVYLGDVSVNGDLIDLANAKKTRSGSGDAPLVF